jgi:uncharacterized membrane protein
MKMNTEIVLDSNLQSEKSIVWWLYVAHTFTFLFSLGTFSWIPLIINFVKRGDTVGTYLYSHHVWQIRSFLWFVVWMVIAAVLAFTFIGIPLALLLAGIAWIWKAYRLIKGFVDLAANRAMPV